MAAPEAINRQNEVLHALHDELHKLVDQIESIRFQLERALRDAETTKIAYAIENGLGIPHPLNDLPVLRYCCDNPKLMWFGQADYPGVVCQSCGYLVASDASVIFEPGELWERIEARREGQQTLFDDD